MTGGGCYFKERVGVGEGDGQDVIWVRRNTQSSRRGIGGSIWFKHIDLNIEDLGFLGSKLFSGENTGIIKLLEGLQLLDVGGAGRIGGGC